MARIKIKDLPKDMKISKEEMKKVVGGTLIDGTSIRFPFEEPVPKTPPQTRTDEPTRVNRGLTGPVF